MNRLRQNMACWLGVFAATAPVAGALAEQAGLQDPHIAYVYPAGGSQGTDFEVTVGGQYLSGTTKAYVSGEGIDVTVVKYARPASETEANALGKKLQRVEERVKTEMKNREMRRVRGGYEFTFLRIAKEMGVDAEDLKVLDHYRKARTDPKRQLNPQLAETVGLRFRVDRDADPGERELRLRTASGLSNLLRFHVGQLPEHRETEPNDKTADRGIWNPLPGIINGQIMPGDVDRFRFKAPQGVRLVIAVSARQLIPYLADTVPGWFQATVTLYDAKGNEVAYADDYRFNPDPVLYFEIPKLGEYVLEIKDAIYRGREDFVYRITLGELPFVTSIFPLGGRVDGRTNVEVNGWNLPVKQLTLSTTDNGPGIHPMALLKNQLVANQVPFAVDTLPEHLEKEPNNEPKNAQEIRIPLIVNGHIDRPGDWDVFRFHGDAGVQIVAEVQARRLGSPVDSLLELTDPKGRRIVANDDHEDKAAGLTTHHADSRLDVKIPAEGDYYLRLGDTQHKGGRAYGYRLHIHVQRPDFELRVLPPSINARAGTSVPITVLALRKDGFSDAIALNLKDAPPGFVLSDGRIPAGQEDGQITLTVPSSPTREPIRLRLEGRATINGREIRRLAVPAQDNMQAFIYHHLVCAKELLVSVTGRAF